MAGPNPRFQPETYLKNPSIALPTGEDLELLENAIAGAPLPKIPTGYPNIVFVENIPAVPADKLSKLTSLLFKVFINVGEFDPESGFIMPTNEDGSSKGFAFIEYKDEKTAKDAIATLNGYRLDKTHIFSVRAFDEIRKYAQIPDEYQPPKTQQPVAQENMLWWVQDKDNLMHDQFVTRIDSDTEVFWNTRRRGNPIISRKGFTESYLAWSPQGTFLTTYHKKGILLWGGESWERTNVIEHLGVQLVDFSPAEKYVVTFSETGKENVIVWDIKTSKKIFVVEGIQNTEWPYFKWSHDDRFFANLIDGVIHIREIVKTPTGAFSAKSYYQHKINNKIEDFVWSPAQTNILSYWVPETKNIPAKIAIYDVVAKKELRTKNIFNVKGCKMHWQNRGEYLCVKVDRETSKRITSTNFEIFFAREKNIPIESIELKDTIIAFAWENSGSRFAFIHQTPGTNKSDVTFYNLVKLKPVKTKTLEKRQATHLYWSPKGDNIVMATIKTSNGVIEFYNAAQDIVYATAEHYQTTNIEWDPSGRFVTTSASSWVHQMENGYTIWSFAGKQLSRNIRDKFYQFLWRPRPQSLLTDRQIRDIKSNVKNYSKIFSVEEKERERQAKSNRKITREKSASAFEALMAKRRAEIAQVLAEKKFAPIQERVIISRQVEEVIESFVQVVE